MMWDYKILISNSFEKEFKKLNLPITIERFIKMIKVYKFIFLDGEFYKVKLYNPSLRWVVYFDKDKKLIVPVLLFKKTDKKYGENLILNDKIFKKIDTMFGKISQDIKEGNYKIFTI